jgi:hypothetical protein
MVADRWPGSACALSRAGLEQSTGFPARSRFRGLLDFGALIGEHDRAFDEKWVKAQGAGRAELGLMDLAFAAFPDLVAALDLAIAVS